MRRNPFGLRPSEEKCPSSQPPEKSSRSHRSLIRMPRFTRAPSAGHSLAGAGFVWLTQIVFYGLCWVPWHGRQAILRRHHRRALLSGHVLALPALELRQVGFRPRVPRLRGLVCRANGLELGTAMVARGWAVDYAAYSHGYYRAEEAAARTARLGIWSGQFELPADWRRHRR